MPSPLHDAVQEAQQHRQDAIHLSAEDGRWRTLTNGNDITHVLLRAQIHATLAVCAEVRAVRLALQGG